MNRSLFLLHTVSFAHTTKLRHRPIMFILPPLLGLARITNGNMPCQIRLNLSAMNRQKRPLHYIFFHEMWTVRKKARRSRIIVHLHLEFLFYIDSMKLYWLEKYRYHNSQHLDIKQYKMERSHRTKIVGLRTELLQFRPKKTNNWINRSLVNPANYFPVSQLVQLSFSIEIHSSHLNFLLLIFFLVHML